MNLKISQSLSMTYLRDYYEFERKDSKVDFHIKLYCIEIILLFVLWWVMLSVIIVIFRHIRILYIYFFMLVLINQRLVYFIAMTIDFCAILFFLCKSEICLRTVIFMIEEKQVTFFCKKKFSNMFSSYFFNRAILIFVVR